MSRARRLEVILRLRRIAEDEAKAGLRRAALTLAEARGGRDAAGRRLAAEQAWLTGLHARGCPGGELAQATLALGLAEELVDAADRAVVTAIAGIAGARDALAEATRARTVVERLRDRFLEAERLEAERQEIIELAEIAGVRHAWRVIEGEAAA